MEEKHRRKILSSYREFISEFSMEPLPARHHEFLIDKLQAVADGKINRLMVFMPPGAAKSYYANVMFSAWYVGAFPGKKLITTSFNSTVAEKWGRKVRSVVREADYERVFGARLSKDSSAAGRWELSNGSEYYAAGMMAGITSYRADLAVIDDPVAGRDEAESETLREKLKEAYLGDLWTRLKPGAAVVLIMTRWHEDDLAGWLLERAKNGGEQWEVVSLPMLAEENDPLGREYGAPLWPEWFTPEMVAEAKTDTRRWTSLYQQRPAPEDGDFFKKEWFRYYTTPPKELRVYGTSDYATKDGQGDYTVHAVWGIDPDSNIYLLDLWRGQTNSLVWVEQLLALAKQWKPLEWGEESGQIVNSVGPLIERRQRETGTMFYRNQYPSTANKSVRAQAIRGYMAMGKVYFPKGADFLSDFESELLVFPGGKNDDQVDALSLVGRMLSTLIKADKMPQHKQKNITDMPTISQMAEEHDRYMRKLSEEDY